MTRLAVAADLHVDDFGTRVDAATGWNARFEDGIAAIEFVADATVEAGATALVVAGDYTEAKNPSPPRVARIQRALATGPRRQVHLRGNHDSERGGQSIVDVLGAVEGWDGFTVPGVSVVDDVAICAIPFLGPSHLRTTEGFEAAAPADINRALAEAYLTIARGLYANVAELDVKTRILIGHQQLAGGRMNDSQAAFLGERDLVIDSRALAAIGFDAVLFGHVHKAQPVFDDPTRPVMFVGSTHRVDFAEQDEEKRFLLVDNAAERLSIESVAIPARRFVTLTSPRPDDAFNVHDAIVRCVDVDPDVDVAELRRVLEAAGAFEVQEIRMRPVVRPEIAGGMAEGLTAHEALASYFDGQDDAEATVERGRQVLAEVVA